MTKRENLAEYLERQAFHCQMVADKLRAGEDVSDDIWLIDCRTTDEWEEEMAAIEAQEQMEYEHNQAIERRATA